MLYLFNNGNYKCYKNIAVNNQVIQLKVTKMAIKISAATPTIGNGLDLIS